MQQSCRSGYLRKSACSSQIRTIAPRWPANPDSWPACSDDELLMRRLTCLFLLTLRMPAVSFACATGDEPGPAFKVVPELARGFHELYEQHFPEARMIFTTWESAHPEEPFGQVAIAASYLFEELYRQGVLTSDFFLNEKRFLHGIEGKPDPERMKSFQDALDSARNIAKVR